MRKVNHETRRLAANFCGNLANFGESANFAMTTAVGAKWRQLARRNCFFCLAKRLVASIGQRNLGFLIGLFLHG